MLRNADRGAWSIELIMDLPTKRTTVRPRLGAKGSAPRKRELGKWVRTMARIRPARREREAENMLPNVERNL